MLPGGPAPPDGQMILDGQHLQDDQHMQDGQHMPPDPNGGDGSGDYGHDYPNHQQFNPPDNLGGGEPEPTPDNWQAPPTPDAPQYCECNRAEDPNCYCFPVHGRYFW